MTFQATVRHQIIALLQEASLTTLDISQEVRISEKEVQDHLAHVARSILARGCKLTITPSVCLACGYTFGQRRRFTRPGRCPNCRASRITRPAFNITNPNTGTMK